MGMLPVAIEWGHAGVTGAIHAVLHIQKSVIRHCWSSGHLEAISESHAGVPVGQVSAQGMLHEIDACTHCASQWTLRRKSQDGMCIATMEGCKQIGECIVADTGDLSPINQDRTRGSSCR